VILYLDTSSLVKLYVDEPGSADVRRLVDQAELVTASVVAYPEARAAFARRKRERSLTPGGFRRAKRAFEADWPHVLALDVAGSLARQAGELAERERLRGFDALHLAAYLLIAREFPDEDVRFSSADSTLERAARRVGRRGRRSRRR
jgi:predicted nucleic acid-binding protein